MIARATELGDAAPDALRLLELDVVAAARSLIGCTLRSTTPAGVTAGIIVEVEAYRALDDPACHAYRRRTVRNDPIYGPAGTLYVYLSYGLHTMLNLATGPDGEGEAVLIRALVPTAGLDLMAARRNLTDPKLLCKGPARLAQALGIELSWSGEKLGVAAEGHQLDLVAPAIRYENNRQVVATTRIGISQGRDLPWRFLEAGNPYVSRGIARAADLS